MQYTIILIILYAVLVIFDIIPQIRSGKWTTLWFSLLVYSATFILQVLFFFDVISRNFIGILGKLFKPFLH